MSRLTNPHSPIQDIELSSLDFDACLGVVEKEIMNLTDGKLFAGDKIVSEVEYIEYAVRCQEKSK